MTDINATILELSAKFAAECIKAYEEFEEASKPVINPVVTIEQSGGTYVAEYDGVDYMCFNPETDNGVWSIDKFLIQKKHGNLLMSWKPIKDIKITDEIAKLRPMMTYNGFLHTLLYVDDDKYFPYATKQKGEKEIGRFTRKGRLATVHDLKESK